MNMRNRAGEPREEDRMLHNAAMRVQNRLDNEEKRRLMVERAKNRAALFRLVLVLGIILVGLWLWRSGRLDTLLGKKDEQKEMLGDLFQPGSATQTNAPASVVDTVVESVKGAKDAVVEAIAGTGERKAASPLAAFEGAVVDYWKNAVAEDRPGKDRRLSFTGLVPDGKGGFTLLALEMGGGADLAIRSIGPNGESTILNKGAFNKMIAQTPYLVVREGRAYFCSAGQKKAQDLFAVPPKGGAFNPAGEEFGALLDCLARAKVRPPTLKYRVALELDKLKKEVPVATVGFGAKISREVFEGSVRSLVNDAETVQILLKTAKVRVSAVK